MTQAFNTVFSRTTRPGVEQRKYYELGDAKIVPVHTRFSKISLGFGSFSEETQERDVEKVGNGRRGSGLKDEKVLGR